MKKYAVIVAGGSGTRMGSDIPKQFLTLKGHPLLLYTLNTFLNAYEDLNIILVVPANHFATAERVIELTPEPTRIQLTAGGETRFHSVKNGLQKITEKSVVFVHDGVRCLLTTELIHRCYEMTLAHGNAIPAIEPVDSLRFETSEGSEVIDREKVKLIQTPQTFHSEIIQQAYDQEFQDTFTDEASVVEKLGVRIHLVTGEPTNIKITRPIDYVIAEKILEDRNRN